MKFKRTQLLTQCFNKYDMRMTTKNLNVPWKLRKKKQKLRAENNKFLQELLKWNGKNEKLRIVVRRIMVGMK